MLFFAKPLKIQKVVWLPLNDLAHLALALAFVLIAFPLCVGLEWFRTWEF